VLIQVKAVPDKKGLKGRLDPSELAILDEIVGEWKTVSQPSPPCLLTRSDSSLCR
jgi:hypothetical protein